jgi:hypothetical protein
MRLWTTTLRLLPMARGLRANRKKLAQGIRRSIEPRIGRTLGTKTKGLPL